MLAVHFVSYCCQMSKGQIGCRNDPTGGQHAKHRASRNVDDGRRLSHDRLRTRVESRYPQFQRSKIQLCLHIEATK